MIEMRRVSETSVRARRSLHMTHISGTIWQIFFQCLKPTVVLTPCPLLHECRPSAHSSQGARPINGDHRVQDFRLHLALPGFQSIDLSVLGSFAKRIQHLVILHVSLFVLSAPVQLCPYTGWLTYLMLTQNICDVYGPVSMVRSLTAVA